jgi:ribulose-5-phosphate 4-epimerase/fuculose-1-phosphate aldolase
MPLPAPNITNGHHLLPSCLSYRHACACPAHPCLLLSIDFKRYTAGTTWSPPTCWRAPELAVTRGAMDFAADRALREEMLAACRVLTHFRIVEGFGHVSARIPGSERILITPRRALGLVTDAELVELDAEERQLAGDGKPPLELAMHLAIYRRRADVKAIVRGHPRHVAAYACAGEPLRVAHGFGANLGAAVPVIGEPYLVTNAEMGKTVAEALADGEAVILRANGMLAVGQSVPHACVQALFLEETAEVQLLAQAAGLKPRFYSADEAARRHGDDRVLEPLRAWEYYRAVAEGKILEAR